MIKKTMFNNFSLQLIKTIMSILFPIISFPYATRVLGKEGVGAVSYTESIISYFALFAALGISAYGTREAAKVRDNKEALSELCTELLCINLITSLLAYAGLGVMLYLQYFNSLYWLMIVQSSVIFLTTIGMEWLFVALEEYKYMTVRSVVFQIIALFGLFIFVKDKNDYITYAIINIFASVGCNMVNGFYAIRYIKVFPLRTMELNKHIRPLIFIFATNIASAIYLNMDTTMLGFYKGNAEVGLYTAAVRIVRAVLMCLGCIATVILPRAAYYLSKGQMYKFKQLIVDGGNYTQLMSVPSGIGLLCVSKELIMIFGGKEFIDAYCALSLLAISSCFSALSRIFVWQILVPMGKEVKVVIITTIGAIVNFILNLYFVPYVGLNGAAFTTLISEIAVFIVSIKYCSDYFHIKKIFLNSWQYLVSAFSIVIISYVIDGFSFNIYLLLLLKVCLSAISYGAILFILKNLYFLKSWKSILELNKKLKVYSLRIRKRSDK